MPRPVQRAIGLALYAVQLGETPPDAKVLKGFGGAGILELIEDHRSGTYRAVYTVRFAGAIYVLHVYLGFGEIRVYAPRVGVAAGAKPKGYPDFGEIRVYFRRNRNTVSRHHEKNWT